MKRKFQFEDYEICAEAAQIENKTNHLGKNKKLMWIVLEKTTKNS